MVGFGERAGLNAPLFTTSVALREMGRAQRHISRRWQAAPARARRCPDPIPLRSNCPLASTSQPTGYPDFKEALLRRGWFHNDDKDRARPCSRLEVRATALFEACWPPTRGVLLAGYTDRRLLAAYCSPLARLRVAAYNWPCYAGRLLLAVFDRPPTAGQVLVVAYYWPPTTGHLLPTAYYWPSTAGRL